MPLYNTVFTFRLSGPLDEQRFVDAFRRLVESTDALRLVVSETDGAPKAQFLAECPQPCELIEFAGDAEHASSQWIQDRARQRLDDHICLYDSALLRVSENEHIWYLNLHHLITDGWSTGVIFRRQQQLYENSDRSSSDLQYPQHSEYVDYERQSKGTAELHAHQEWWEGQIGDLQHKSRFYEGRVVPGTHEHTRVSVQLGAELSNRIRQLTSHKSFRALSSQMSLFRVFATAIFAWLYRIDHQKDLCIGVTTHGRLTRQFRETAGLFMQLLPFRISINDTADKPSTLASLAGQVASQSTQFFGHAVPGVASSARPKTIDVALNVIPATFGEFAGLTTNTNWVHSGFGDPSRRLTVSVHDFDDTHDLELLFDFASASFSKRGQQLAIEHLVSTLGAITEDVNQLLSRFPLVSEEDFAQLDQLRSKAESRGGSQTLWERFRQVAESSPNQIAIQDDTETVTYDQLLERATTLGHKLKTKGIEKGDVVPVVCHRNASTVECYLGIMAVGAAFMPIDADLPIRRIQWLQNDSKSAWLVRANSPPAIESIDGNQLASQTVRAPECDGAAYVLYTSGSTGKPNGVIVGHKSVLNLLSEFERLAPLQPSARCSWWTNVGFDVSIYEVFSAILFARTLVIPSEETRVDASKLIPWLKETSITSTYLPGFVLNDLEDWLLNHGELSLERLLVGVEPIPQNLLASIARKQPSLRVINGYGPTEATICATLHCIDPTDDSPRPASIGVPVAGTRCYVLDRHGNVAPRGTVGELYIGGDCLAHAYYNRNDLTRQRFIDDPLNLSNDRFFRTGDMVRLRDDNLLEFCSRVDDQLKFRGQRIERAEIVHAVGEHSGIDECVVKIQQDTERESRLIAYYTSQKAIDESSLRHHVTSCISRSMVPSCFVRLPAVPRTRNGKVDFAALPRVEVTSTSSLEGYVHPRNQVESTLADIWSDVLSVQNVGVRDNFFDRGGDSISAIRIASRAGRSGIPLSPSDLFQLLTIEEIARDHEANAASKADEPKIVEAAADSIIESRTTRAESTLDPKTLQRLKHLISRADKPSQESS